MGMEMPAEVKWLFPIVVGQSWPEGDEDKLRALRDAWKAAAAAIGPVVQQGNQASQTALSTWTGASADAFREEWKKFTDGDGAYFKSLTDACEALAKSCDQTALEIEYTKYMIIASLIILAIQIAAMIAAAFATFGATSAGVVPAQIATRVTVQMLFRQLLQKLAQEGFKKIALQLVKKVAMEVLKNVAMNVAMDTGIQGLQMAQGNRTSWDWSKTEGAAASGVAAGVVGAASAAIPKGATSALSHSATGQVVDAALRGAGRGAVEGAAMTVGQAALTGNLGSLNAQSLATGAAAGAMGGGVGAGKESLNHLHGVNTPGHITVGEPGSASHGSGSHISEPSAAAHPEPARRASEPAPSDPGSHVTGGAAPTRSEFGAPAAAEPGSRITPEHSTGGTFHSDSATASPAGSVAASHVAEPATSHAMGDRLTEQPASAAAHTNTAPPTAAEAPHAAASQAPAAGGMPGMGGHASSPGAGGVGGSPAAGGAGHRPSGGYGSAVPVETGTPRSAGTGGYGQAMPGNGMGHPGSAPQRPPAGNMSGYPQSGFGPTGNAPINRGTLPHQPEPPMGGFSGPPMPSGHGPIQGYDPRGGPQQGPPPGSYPYPPQGPAPGGFSYPQQGPAPAGYSHPQQGPAPAGYSHPQQGAPPAGYPHPPQGPAPGSYPHSQQGPPPGGYPQWGPGGRPGEPGPHPPQRYPQQTPPQRPEQGLPPGYRQQGPPGPPQGYGPRPPQMPPHAPGNHPPQGFAPGARPPVDPRSMPPHPGFDPRQAGQPMHPGQGVQQQPPPVRQAEHAVGSVREAPVVRPAEPVVPPREGQRPAQPHTSEPHQPAPREGQRPAQPQAPEPHQSAVRETPVARPVEPVVAPREGRPAAEPGQRHEPASSTPGHTSEPHQPASREGQRPAQPQAPEHAAGSVRETPVAHQAEPAVAPREEHPTAEPGQHHEAASSTAEHAPEPHQPAPQHEAPAPEPARGETISGVLDGNPHKPDLSQDYHFNEGHRVSSEDMASVRRGLNEHFDEARVDALHRRDQHAALAHLSNDAALALHAYTRHELAYSANEAFRKGPDHEGFVAANHQVRAVEAALHELPKLDGVEVVRGINFLRDQRLIELTAGEYRPGHVAVETTMTSASIKGNGLEVSKFGPDVELHIQSKTFRDISALSGNPHEREALGKVGVQLFVHSNELVRVPDGPVKRVIHAEEIVPGDPRYLDPEAAKQAMAERRQRYAAAEPEFQGRSRGGLENALAPQGHPVEPVKVTPEPARPGISDVLDGKADPPAHAGYAGVADHQPADVPFGGGHSGDHDWSPLARATNPPGEPAIHADTANPQQQANYVAQRHPELTEVNRHFHDPNAFADGYQTNCTRGVVAYAERLQGVDAHAEPVLPHELATKGTLEYVQERLGGQWQEHNSYDSVIRTMRDQPIGSHAVVGVLYEGPGGQVFGHVAMVTHTKEGVAFIDPQSGTLMRLPHPPVKLDLLPFGSHERSQQTAAPMHETPRTEHAPQAEHAVPAEHVPQAEHPVPAEHAVPAEHGGFGGAADHPGGQDVANYLNEPHVAEALSRATEAGSTIKVDGVDVPVADIIRQQLPQHPELARLMVEHAYLEDSLLARPNTIANLLVHDEAIPVLEHALHEVSERGPEAILTDHEVEGGPQPTPITSEQHEVVAKVEESLQDYGGKDQQQSGFDQSRKDDQAYREEYLRMRYADARVAQRELNSVVTEIAEQTGGEAGWRKEEKSWRRATDKVNNDYSGDASRLVDLAGAKIEFNSVQDVYRALDRVLGDPRVEIVKFKDRFAKPQDSGYRDLQMSVRMSNGHIAELRLHLSSIDSVAKFEHALYEVSRDFDSLAHDEGRTLTAEERALKAALVERQRTLFWEALQRGL